MKSMIISSLILSLNQIILLSRDILNSALTCGDDKCLINNN